MELGIFALQDRPCPKCGIPVPSTTVFERTAHGFGNHYTAHSCAICGPLVYRIIGFDVAASDGRSAVMTVPVHSAAEETEVLRAFNELL
jgi:hypothetical protein